MSDTTFLSDHDYDFIYSRVPRVCADLLIVNSKNEVLMTKRTIEPYINHWHLPGGRIKFRESILDAIQRISVAELGVNLIAIAAEAVQGRAGINEVLPKMVGYCEYPDEIQKEQPRHSISLVHLIKVDDNIQFNAEDKYQWCSEMPELVIPPIKDFLLKNKFL